LASWSTTVCDCCCVEGRSIGKQETDAGDSSRESFLRDELK
jgi:hypothetical protein